MALATGVMLPASDGAECSKALLRGAYGFTGQGYSIGAQGQLLPYANTGAMVLNGKGKVGKMTDWINRASTQSVEQRDLLNGGSVLYPWQSPAVPVQQQAPTLTLPGGQIYTMTARRTSASTREH